MRRGAGRSIDLWHTWTAARRLRINIYMGDTLANYTKARCVNRFAARSCDYPRRGGTSMRETRGTGLIGIDNNLYTAVRIYSYETIASYRVVPAETVQLSIQDFIIALTYNNYNA